MIKETQGIRYIFTMNPEHKAKIDTLSKGYKVTQGEVIEALLDQYDIEKLAPLLIAKRNAKEQLRNQRSETTKKLIGDVADLTPEQLAVVQATIAKMKAETT